MGSIYDETIEELNSRIEANPILLPLKDSIEFQNIIKSVAYSQEIRYKRELVAIAESVTPTSEKMLLLKLLTEKAYIKFQTPLTVTANASIESTSSLKINRGAKLTSGGDLFELMEDVVIPSDNQKISINLSKSQTVKQTITVSQGAITKHNTGFTYREISEVSSSSLKFSQMFVEADSNAMLEVDSDGNLWVILLNKFLFVGENIEIDINITKPTVAPPSRLEFIDFMNVKIEDISVRSVSEPFMTKEEMQEALKYMPLEYGQYRSRILSRVPNIAVLRIWFQREEDEAVGYKEENINKIFVSYITKDETVGTMDEQIEREFNRVEKELYIEFREPNVFSPSLTVTIHNYSNTQISQATIDSYKNSLVGFVDNPKTLAFKNFAEMFDVNNVHVNVDVQNLGVTNNRMNFSKILLDKINVVIEDE